MSTGKRLLLSFILTLIGIAVAGVLIWILSLLPAGYVVLGVWGVIGFTLTFLMIYIALYDIYGEG